MLAVVACVVVVWSFRGEISTYVGAHGILLNNSGGIVDAVALGSGILTEVVPQLGDTVEKGQVVAEVTNPETAERHRSALDLLRQRERTLLELRATIEEENRVFAENLQRQRQRLGHLEATARQLIDTARARLENHRRLLAEHVVTRLTVERSQKTLDRAQQELFGIMRQRDELEAGEFQRRNRLDVRISDAKAREQAARHQANEIATRLGSQRITAPAGGRVIEVKASVGSVLRPGQPVISIEPGGKRIELLIYVPPADGGRVKPGMEVLITPSTVRREEHGALKGVVSNISAFPASLEGMVSVLQNRSLARSISENGQPYAGRVALSADPSTLSGFSWTSPKGAHQEVASGTLATAEIKVESQTPITLVVPLLKETFGL